MTYEAREVGGEWGDAGPDVQGFFCACLLRAVHVGQGGNNGLQGETCRITKAMSDDGDLGWKCSLEGLTDKRCDDYVVKDDDVEVYVPSGVGVSDVSVTNWLP